jgi:hypothetical protein
MHALMLLLLASTAHAGEPDTPWSDGLSTNAPTRAWVELGGAAAFGLTDYGFVDLRGGLPFWERADGAVGIGMNVVTGLSVVHVPEEGRMAAVHRGLQGEFWVNVYGPHKRSVHGIGIRGGSAVNLPNTFWLQHTEIASHWSVFYDGLFSRGPVEVAFRADTGGDAIQLGHAIGSVSMTWSPTPRLGLQAGVQAGWTPLQVAMLGVRGRPVDGLEIGAGVVLPFADAYGASVGTPSPTLQVKWFDAR